MNDLLTWLKDHLDLNALLTGLVEWLPQLAAAFIIVVAFALGSRLSRKALRPALRKSGMHATLIELLVNKIYHYALMTVGLVMALDQLGVNVAAALAGLGVAGIAVGFAAQDTLSNIISGIMIFLDRPFLVDDWVTTGDQYGQVANITLRTTRIRTNQNTYVVIPNRMIIDQVLINHSKEGELRVDVPVGIAYKEDIDRAREVLMQAIASIEHRSARRESDVVVEALGDSSVNLLVRVWIDDGQHERPVHYAVVEASKKALDEADIEIPFPHLQLFFDDIRKPVWDDMARFVRSARAGGDDQTENTRD